MYHSVLKPVISDFYAECNSQSLICLLDPPVPVSTHVFISLSRMRHFVAFALVYTIFSPEVTVSHYVAQASLKFTTLLPQPPSHQILDLVPNSLT